MAHPRPASDDDVRAVEAARLHDGETDLSCCFELLGAAILVKATAYVAARLDGYSGRTELHDLIDFCAPFGIVVPVDQAERLFADVCDKFSGAANHAAQNWK
jgi:hypothetical protein